jgi:hypothetical protein
MTKVYKDGQERDVKESKLAGYLEAGWQLQSATILVKDTTSSKPTVTASAAVKSAEETVSNLDKEKEDGNISW